MQHVAFVFSTHPKASIKNVEISKDGYELFDKLDHIHPNIQKGDVLYVKDTTTIVKKNDSYGTYKYDKSIAVEYWGSPVFSLKHPFKPVAISIGSYAKPLSYNRFPDLDALHKRLTE